MKCPDCESHLNPKQVDAVEVDYCRDCGGTWFDAGELERVGRQAAGIDSVTGFSRNLPAGACPRCSDATLLGGQMGRHSVARCPGCRGIWVPQPIRTVEERRVVGESVIGALEIAIGVFDIFF
jgi:Zn-finger nucleic acid-binding protein